MGKAKFAGLGFYLMGLEAKKVAGFDRLCLTSVAYGRNAMSGRAALNHGGR